MRVLTVVGTRPQLIKAATLQPALRERHEEFFVDTGQHWDKNLAGSFFGELALAPPDMSLGAGGGTHAEQTAAMLRGLEPILLDQRPDAVVVYGDTNSTLAGSLAAAKVGIPIAHVEAGLRSFDRRMPEEINRVVADHLAQWLFAPTRTAVANLAAEGVTSGVSLVGDLMEDLAGRTLPLIRNPDVLKEVAEEARLPRSVRLSSGRYLYATVHRQENREPTAIRGWLAILALAARVDRPVVLALHPGTRAAVQREGLAFPDSVVVSEPMGYRASLALQLHAAAVLTDSGGVQREAAWLRVPCLVLRDTTEWVEAVEGSNGAMTLVGVDAAKAREPLERLGDPDESARAAEQRALHAAIRPGEVGRAISDALG